MQWSADASVIYYVRKHPQTLLPYQVFLHHLSEDISHNRLVYEELDDTYYVSLGETTSTEVRLLDAHDIDTKSSRLYSSPQR
ncbi:MAG: hypothetical protein ACSLEN_09195 [Candidatus Malihini olakiniferum]